MRSGLVSAEGRVSVAGWASAAGLIAAGLLTAGLLALGLLAAGLIAGRAAGLVFHGLVALQVLLDLGAPPPPAPQACPRSALVVLSFGQSNAANSVLPRLGRSWPANLLQYDWRRDRCLPYREPLAGSDGQGGHPLSPLLRQLAGRSSRPVLLVPFASGSSSVGDWAYGPLARRQALVLARLRRRQLAPALVFWHQGESDAGPPGTRGAGGRPLSRQAYGQALGLVVQRTRAVFPGARFGIALVSRCRHGGPWPPIREAQRQLAAASPGAFVSADSDQVWGGFSRYDGCHFSPDGARRLSALTLAALERLGLF